MTTEHPSAEGAQDAAQLEIDHLRGATKMMEPAGEYPQLPEPAGKIQFPAHPYESAWVSSMDAYDESQMCAYADATCDMRAQADSRPAPVAQGDAEDAARYRWLAAHCRSTAEHWGGRWSIVVDGPAPKSHDSEDDFDAAIDAARKQGAIHEQR